MLSVNRISKSYGLDTVLSNINFTINAGERLGLIGPNGCGKTTLLRILTGSEQADGGTFFFDSPGTRVGYLPQGAAFAEDDTLGSYIQRCEGGLDQLSERLAGLAAGLGANPHQPDLQAEYDRTLAELQSAAQNAGRGAPALAALGLDGLSAEMPVRNLSGGQKTRLALAGVLLSNPSLLLLDEPTNHLDLEMLEWLEDWLLGFPGAVLLVSHDRAFLDQIATGILEIDPHTHELRAYPGNYSDYLQFKETERARQLQEYSDQQVEIARLRQAALHFRQIGRFRVGGKADSGDKFAKGFFANRGKGTVGRAKHIEARIEQLTGEDRIDRPARSWQMKIDLDGTAESGRDVLVLDNLTAGYPGNPLLSELDLTLRYGQRAVLIGPNGCGKTTLLRTVTGQIPPLAGRLRLGSGVRLGYMDQEQANLDPALNPLTSLFKVGAFNETEARSFLSLYLFKGDDVFTPVGKLSYGERARLSLALLVGSGCNLLLLDEPVNHLDIPARSRFEQALGNFHGTVLAVAHDRYFIQAVATHVWQVVDGHVRSIEM